MEIFEPEIKCLQAFFKLFTSIEFNEFMSQKFMIKILELLIMFKY
jgi:hypothetical protein